MTIAAEPTITPLLLRAWSANSNAPNVCEGVTDIFNRLLSFNTSTCTSVQVQVLPVLQQIFVSAEANAVLSGTIGVALELLKSVLLNIEKHTRALHQTNSTVNGSSAAPQLLHPLLFSTILPHVLNFVLHTDDHDAIHTGTTTLTAYLRIDANQVANISMPVVLPGSPAGTAPTPMTGLQVLCALINQLLNPALSDQVAHNVGSLIIQVVFSLGGVLGEANVKELIKGGRSQHTISTHPFHSVILMMIPNFNHLSIELRSNRLEL